MSNKLEKSEVLVHIQNCIEKLKIALNEMAESSDSIDLKKASLLSYWVEEYVNYIQEEPTFLPERLIRYKSGDIIQVNFGYRIGSEIGGLHYAIVLDNANSKKSPVITVVPLGSLKPGFRETKFRFELNTGLYELVKLKAQKMIDKTKFELNKLTEEIEDVKNLSEAEQNVRITQLKKKIKKSESTIEHINNLLKEIKKMNQGSIVDVGQIVTISKQRIYNPKKSDDILYNIRATEQDMNRIYENLKNNFIKA